MPSFEAAYPTLGGVKNGGGREIRTPMWLAPRRVSSPLPCPLRLAPRARRLSHTGALIAALLLSFTPRAATAGVSDWLSSEDALERCGALVVLNGDFPGRAHEAA